VDLDERGHGEGVAPLLAAARAGHPARALVPEEAEGLGGGEEVGQAELQRLPFRQPRVRLAQRVRGLGGRAPLGGRGEAQEGERDGLAGRPREALREGAAGGAVEPLPQVADADLEVLVRIERRGRQGEEQERRGAHPPPCYPGISRS
jgi:hypothetical protein